MAEETAMARETAEAPSVVARMLDRNRDALAEAGALIRRRNPAFIATAARGSSDHAAGYLKYLSEIMLGLPFCSLGASGVSIYRAPIAQEAALKLKESSGLHAEAYSAAEVLHGPMELVTHGFPVLVFAPGDAALETTALAAANMRNAGARLLMTGSPEMPVATTAHP